MKPRDKAIELVAMLAAIAALALYFARRASASVPATPERTGVVTIGPVEQVGGIGNTTPDFPRPGQGSNVDISPIDSPSRQLCLCAPLNSFAPACEGYTWISIPAPFGAGYIKQELRSKLGTNCTSGAFN